VSIRLRGELTLGTRTEIKNLNSFASVEAAIGAEIERQAALLEAGEEVVQATMAFDPQTGRTRVLRLKENSDDYRYFPDPDLIPLMFGPERIERVRAEMPELPQQKRARFESQHCLSAYEARLLTGSRELSDFYEAAVAAHGKPDSAKLIANWTLRDLLRALKERDLEFEAVRITPVMLAALVTLVDDGRITMKTAQELLPELVLSGGDPQEIVRARGLEAVSDAGLIEATVKAVLDANPDVVETLRSGDAKAINFLMGQVMKKTQGKADPGQVRASIGRRLTET
jgi:aspartyl-tRNA(Asn)/glutamyl-tRNA(Gln) amidotransferase subunit B